MSSLPIKKFGDVCHFVRGPFGGSLKKSCFVEEGYAVYEQQHAIYDQFTDIRYFVDEDKFNEMIRFELKAGDLIMSCSGTMGKVAIVPNDVQRGIINQALLKLTPSEELDVEFLRYYMSSPTFNEGLEKHTVGAAIKNVASVKILKTLEIPIPPLEEQKQIVALLDKAFEAIDKAKANIEQNIINAKELFQSKLNEIFSQKGEGWEEKTFEELGTLQTGTTPPTNDSSNYGDYIPFVKPAHFNTDGSIIVGDSMLSKVGLSKGRLFEGASVLMVCIGATIGKTGFTTESVSANQQINALTPYKDYRSKFLYYGFISPYVQNQVMSIGVSAQATLPIINKTKWSKLKINVPVNLEDQLEYEVLLDKFRLETQQIIKSYRSKLNNLVELKKSILQKAFAGELTAKDLVV